jgi:hypothetical protein
MLFRDHAGVSAGHHYPHPEEAYRFAELVFALLDRAEIAAPEHRPAASVP